MFIDCSKIPDPLRPEADDVYTSDDGAHTVVVTCHPYRSDDEGRYYIRAVRDGTPIAFEIEAFVGILVSLGVQPWGRLDRSAKVRPELTRDPAHVLQRLKEFGPHIRALREQYGLSTGDLARAVGGSAARLSQLELAAPLLAPETDRVDFVLWCVLDGSVSVAAVLRPGDRVLFGVDDTPGTVVRATGVNTGYAVQVEFKAAPRGLPDDTSVHWIGPSELKLANENVATETARAGLGGLLAVALERYIEGGLDNGHTTAGVLRDEAEVRGMFAEALSTNEAQRLIRLHG